jgi:Ca-activated chloride channel family protein
LSGTLGQQVDLRTAFRLTPDAMPMGDQLPLFLGHLPREKFIRLLLELVIHPGTDQESITLGNFLITGDVLGVELDEESSLPIEVQIKTTDEPDPKPPPEPIVAALSHLSLYRMQEKARHEAELGQVNEAARRLENLATHLLAAGERDLAKEALNEAVQLTQAKRLSTEGEKKLKYGTRALLMLPPGSET